jgi:hypothetical protein
MWGQLVLAILLYWLHLISLTYLTSSQQIPMWRTSLATIVKHYLESSHFLQGKQVKMTPIKHQILLNIGPSIITSRIFFKIQLCDIENLVNCSEKKWSQIYNCKKRKKIQNFVKKIDQKFRFMWDTNKLYKMFETKTHFPPFSPLPLFVFPSYLRFTYGFIILCARSQNVPFHFMSMKVQKKEEKG